MACLMGILQITTGFVYCIFLIVLYVWFLASISSLLVRSRVLTWSTFVEACYRVDKPWKPTPATRINEEAAIKGKIKDI